MQEKMGLRNSVLELAIKYHSSSGSSKSSNRFKWHFYTAATSKPICVGTKHFSLAL